MLSRNALPICQVCRSGVPRAAVRCPWCSAGVNTSFRPARAADQDAHLRAFAIATVTGANTKRVR